MTEADDIMVARETPPGWHNLAIGEPAFLQVAFQDLFPRSVATPTEKMVYPPAQGLPALRSALARHLGLPSDEADSIVVTNGARQALIAAMVAARQVYRAKRAWAPTPYWPGFPTLAERADLAWMPYKQSSFPFVELLAWPNNPSGFNNGTLNPKPNNAIRIWDAVYAHDFYGYRPGMAHPSKADVVVGSASKEFGLSGLRVGWAVFKDPEMAAAATAYIETTTSGVSLPAQHCLLSILHIVENNPFYRHAVENAKQMLAWNRKELSAVVFKTTGQLLGDTAMFAWFHPPDPKHFADSLEVARVLMVEGRHCGSPGWFRANLGVTTAAMAAACRALGGECVEPGEYDE